MTKRFWTFQTDGALYGSPAIRKGVVYFGSDDCFLYAVDTATRKLKWRFKTGGLVRCHPAFDRDNIYFTSDDGNLYALDAGSGGQKWKLDIGNAAKERLLPNMDFNWDYRQSSPAISGGVLYIGSVDGNLYAVDIQTGKVKWRFKTGDRVRSSPAVADGLVCVGSWDGFIYAVDAQSGQQKWQFDAHGYWTPVNSSPLAVNGVIYIGSRNYTFYTLDLQTGQKIWTFGYSQGWTESSAALADDVIYVGSSEDRLLYAINGKTGKMKWSFDTDGVAYSTPAVADGVVYTGSAHFHEAFGNFFYAVDIQEAQAAIHLTSAQAKWSIEIGPTLDKSPRTLHGVISSPLVSGRTVYFGGLDGKLFAVSTAP